jgi:hypothetical protein
MCLDLRWTKILPLLYIPSTEAGWFPREKCVQHSTPRSCICMYMYMRMYMCICMLDNSPEKNVCKKAHHDPVYEYMYMHMYPEKNVYKHNRPRSCIHVCLCMYMYPEKNVYEHNRPRPCICMHVYVYVYVYVYAQSICQFHVWIRNMCTCAHTRCLYTSQQRFYACTCMYIYMYQNICVNVCMHTYIHPTHPMSV